jgi:peptidyl-prolyl cis-trans isomerase C
MKVFFVFTKILMVLLLWGLLVTSSFAELNAAEANSADVNAPVLSGTGAEPAEDVVMATVNGVAITQSQADELIEPQLQQLAAGAGQMPVEFIEQQKQQLRQSAVEALIVEQLFNEKVKQANIVVTDEQVDEKIGQMAAQQNLTIEDFKTLIEAYGSDYEKVKEQIKRGLGYEKLMETKWGGQTDVNEAQAREFYNQNIERFKQPEQIRASHILIKSEPDDSNEAKVQAKAKTQQLLEKVKAGDDFGELAAANSSCPSAAQGGDLGYFSRGQMVLPFEQAAFRMEPNQVSDIVETRFGYHIIKVTDKRPAKTLTFEEARADIINTLEQQKKSEFVERFVEELRSQARIVYPEKAKALPLQIPLPQEKKVTDSNQNIPHQTQKD